MRHRRVAFVVAFGSVLAFSSSARAGDPAAAREQVKLGYQLAQQGKCEEAIPHFAESLRLDAKSITLINLASCEEKTARLADALGHWVEARTRAQAEGNAAIEEEAEKRAKALDPKLPRLAVVLPPGAGADAEVVRDGVVLGAASMGVPLPVNPGAHTLVVRAKGHDDTTQQITIAEGESRRVELRMGPARKDVALAPALGATRDGESRGTSPLVLIGFGAAAAGVAVGAVAGVMAFGQKSTADEACTGTTCTRTGLDAVEAGRTLGTVSTIGFLIGGAGAALGIYGLVWGNPKAGASVALGASPLGGGLRGTF